VRFQGKLRFPDQGAADLDVVVEVSDTHVRLSSADESLGSWCLADVVAHRVVANEFELDLQGDTVVFLAEDPINFAYGAVQGMAEGWARYRSMNPVSRRRAVASARRKSEPSRLQDARRVFVAAASRLLVDEPIPVITDVATKTNGVASDRFVGADEVGVDETAGDEDLDESEVGDEVAEVAVEETAGDEDLDESEVGDEVAEVGIEEPAAAEVVAGREVVDEVAEVEVEESAEDDAVARVDEGVAEQAVPDPSTQVPAGRLPRLNAFPPRVRRSVEASEPEPTEKIEESAAASGPTEEASSEFTTSEDEPVLVEPTDSSDREAEPEPEEDTADVPHAVRRKRRRLHAAPAHDHRRAAPEVDESSGEAPSVADPAPAVSPTVDPSTPSEPNESAAAEEASETAAARLSPVARVAWRAPDAEPDSRRSTPEPAERQPLLGAFKDGHHPAETTGLRASVKSIFGRADKDHEHSYVESTTAVGLTRRVCLECGHVSIGVSD
jgi:hypothetical protein